MPNCCLFWRLLHSVDCIPSCRHRSSSMTSRITWALFTVLCLCQLNFPISARHWAEPHCDMVLPSLTIIIRGMPFWQICPFVCSSKIYGSWGCCWDSYNGPCGHSSHTRTHWIFHDDGHLDAPIWHLLHLGSNRYLIAQEEEVLPWLLLFVLLQFSF